MNQIGSLTEILGVDKVMDYAHHQNLLVYSVGCVIVVYNLKGNRKTFITYHSNPIVIVKIINEGRALITIDQSTECNLIVVLWDIASLKIIVQFSIETDFKDVKPIFLSRIKRDQYVILIGNLIHILSLDNINSASCYFHSSLALSEEHEECYEDCKTFFNSDMIALLSRNCLTYARVELSESQTQPQAEMNAGSVVYQMRFPFTLMKNSLRISPSVNWVAFLNSKGICLLYDQNGNSRQSLNPIEQDGFTCCEFHSDIIVLGSSYGKLYGFSLNDLSFRFTIPSFVLKYKEPFLTMRSAEHQQESLGPSIESIHLTEGTDLILIKSSDNSLVLSQLTALIQASIDKKSAYPIDNYSFSHFEMINSIEWSIAPNQPIQFYTCGSDQSLQCSKQVNGHWQSSFFDIGKIFNATESNFSNRSTNKTFLTVLKLHPRYTHKLFAGDNKGCLYLFDLKEKTFQYNKEILNHSIESLSFSLISELVSVGFDNGMNVICDIESNCAVLLRLIDGFYSLSEIEFRRRNGHMLSMGCFFLNEGIGDNVLIYNKSKYELEISDIVIDNYQSRRQGVYSSICKVISFQSEVLDFSLHSSSSYVIALLDNQQIVIVHLLDGAIKAGIDSRNAISYAYCISMDWSGLYLAVNCDFNRERDDNENRREGIILYEIGTGKEKGRVQSLFPISSIDFSPNGEYLSIGGNNGCLAIWKLSDQIHESIVNVLIQMRNDCLFWYQYQISYQFNQLKAYSPNQSNRIALPIEPKLRTLIKDDKKSSHKPLRGELITVENIFEANLENCHSDPKRDKRFVKESAEPNVLLHQSSSKAHDNNKLNQISSIQNNTSHSNSLIDKVQEAKEINEKRRISELKEQLTNRKEAMSDPMNSQPVPLSHSDKQSTRNIKEEAGHFQIERIKQMSLDGNRENYFPMKMLLNDASNFALIKEKYEEKAGETWKSTILPPQNEIEDKERRDTQSSKQRNKPPMPIIDKPIKPVLPFISFNDQNSVKESYSIKENDSRLNNINRAITQLLSPTPHREEPKEEMDLKYSQLTFGGQIARINKDNTPQRYPEPEDIDDDLDQRASNQFNAKPFATISHSKQMQSEGAEKINSSMISNSRQSIADEIDFLNDNIRHFESANKFN